MRLSTVARYLIGDRKAILSLAADRDTPFVGAAFVLSAGLARSYHTVDLLAEPWHLLAPYAVSTVVATILLLTTCIGPRQNREDAAPRGISFLTDRWLPFLGVFWMTAPLAWLYGIPYERFLDELAATEAKVWTLAIVGAWRVLLMTRVLSVLSGRNPVATFFHVMLLADSMVFLALTVAKLPLIQFMAEIRLTDAEQFVSDTILLTKVFAFLSLPVWFFGAIIAFFRPRSWNAALPTQQSDSRAVWILAAGAVLAGLLALPWTQPEQRLATRAESLLYNGRIEEGLEIMSAHSRSDFPPGWEPPPRVGYGEDKPALLDVLDVLGRTSTSGWVREAYLSSLKRRYLEGEGLIYSDSESTWPRARKMLDVLPEGKAILDEYKKQIKLNDEHVERLTKSMAGDHKEDEREENEEKAGDKKTNEGKSSGENGKLTERSPKPTEIISRAHT